MPLWSVNMKEQKLSENKLKGGEKYNDKSQ